MIDWSLIRYNIDQQTGLRFLWFSSLGLESFFFSFVVRNTEIKIYRFLIFHIILHGYVTWSVTLRAVHGLRVFENRLLRKIFGPTRAEVTENWNMLQNEDLRDVHSFPYLYVFGW